MTRSSALRRFPWSTRLMVAADGGRASRRARVLTGTSDWRRDLLDRLGAATIAAVGTGRLRDAAALPWPAMSAGEIESELAAYLPGLRLCAVAIPRQSGRPRLSLLGEQHQLQQQHRDVIVKLGPVGHGVEHETAVLRLLEAAPLPCISTPTVLAGGTIVDGTIAFVATDGLGLDGQRPAIGERLATFERDLAASLASLPSPGDTPGDAVPVHGDLAPWNLRRTGRGLALFDWEGARWGRPGSDLAHYRRTCAALLRS